MLGNRPTWKLGVNNKEQLGKYSAEEILKKELLLELSKIVIGFFFKIPSKLIIQSIELSLSSLIPEE